MATTKSPPSKKLKVEIDNITAANVQQLKTINISTLPVRYSDKFYRDLIEQGNHKYMQFAYWNGFTVGGMCARVESMDAPTPAATTSVPAAIAAAAVGGAAGYTHRLYIMTINVLPAYRRRGIGASRARMRVCVYARCCYTFEIDGAALPASAARPLPPPPF